MDISELAQEFNFVDTVTVERNEEGNIDLKMPQHRYEKSDETAIHQYGWGPFCKFHVNTTSFQEEAGVYIFTANHQIMYIGKARDIHSRIYGISNISPKNCFEGGQQTNCRLNNAILEVIRNQGQVALWAMETADRKQQKAGLIEDYDSPWNLEPSSGMTAGPQQTTYANDTAGKQKSTRSNSTTIRSRSTDGKYEPLYDLLRNADANTIQLSFGKIEKILGAQLPTSARKYDAWWNPSGHSHAEGWAELGWTANQDLDSEMVTFEKAR